MNDIMGIDQTERGSNDSTDEERGGRDGAGLDTPGAAAGSFAAVALS